MSTESMTARVNGYGYGRPHQRAAIHTLELRWEQERREGGGYECREIGWFLDGEPVDPDRLPMGWRTEITLHAPDEEHGYVWASGWLAS